MKHKSRYVVALLSMLVLTLAACAPGASEESILTVGGAVDSEQSLSMSGLEDIGVVDITAEHPRHGELPYQGVRLNDVLDAAGVSSDASSVVFTASDDYSAEVPLADVTACTDCLIAFNDEGGLDMVMPGMEGNTWVKDVVQIDVQ